MIYEVGVDKIQDREKEAQERMKNADDVINKLIEDIDLFLFRAYTNPKGTIKYRKAIYISSIIAQPIHFVPGTEPFFVPKNTT